MLPIFSKYFMHVLDATIVHQYQELPKMGHFSLNWILKRFLAVSVPIGGMDFSTMDVNGFDTMMLTFKPMFKQFYNLMDHDQSMKDFQKDDNGMFKRYFSFCDEGKTGELTSADHAACKIKIREQMRQKLK